MGNESFFSSLFNLDFSKYATRPFLRVLYIIAFVIVALNLVSFLLATWTDAFQFNITVNSEGFNQSAAESADKTESVSSIEDNTAAKVVLTLIIVLQSLINLVIVRVIMEIAVALVSTAAAWGRIKQRGLAA